MDFPVVPNDGVDFGETPRTIRNLLALRRSQMLRRTNSDVSQPQEEG